MQRIFDEVWLFQANQPKRLVMGWYLYHCDIFLLADEVLISNGRQSDDFQQGYKSIFSGAFYVQLYLVIRPVAIILAIS